jgi:hypothetical protein
VRVTCQKRNFSKIPANYRYDMHIKMRFCGGEALQDLKEKAGMVILNFDEEVAWSILEHYK